MSRVEAASGAKYSAHKEAPRRFEPIAPVGTNYVPVGRPDIESLRRSNAPSASPVSPAASRPPPPPSAPRPSAAAASPAPSFGRAPAIGGGRVPAPEDDWDAPAPVSKPPPPPAATRPPVVTASRPTPAVSACHLLAMNSVAYLNLGCSCYAAPAPAGCVQRPDKACRRGSHRPRWYCLYSHQAGTQEARESLCCA
jgi:hypothetical protein